MGSLKTKQALSGGPPLPVYEGAEAEGLPKSLLFEYGHMDDGTIWVKTPRKGLFQIDWLTLRILLELNTGMSLENLCLKYKVDIKEIGQLIQNLRDEGAIVAPREGKITRAEQRDDIDISPFVFLFLILSVIQIEYFQKIAHTFRLNQWYEMIPIGLLSLLPIIIHEVGHYLSSRPHFHPRLGFTFLWFFPAIYIDTHASWCLPKNMRLLINFSGILMDLCFNTLLVIIAIYIPSMEYVCTPLLIIQYTRWSIILNPLVKGDGYWLLSDFTETINMSKKGREYLFNRRFHWLSLYGLLSICFSICSIMGIIWFLLNLFGLRF